MREINRIVVHHSATRRDTTKLEHIERAHEANGWNGCGYHYVIETNGEVRLGRALDRFGAHCSADRANYDSIGICLVGDNTKPEERWNDKQRTALLWLIYSIRTVFTKPDLPVIGHGQVTGARTLCPGRDIVAEGYLGEQV